VTSDDDRQLVAEAATGSQAAGEELFSRHWLPAWRLAFAVTGSAAAADDIAQDSFERAFRSLASFNGRSSFRTWLSRIVLWARHTPPEIAAILSVPLGTVHSRLGRALAELRTRLEETYAPRT
jgi:DNA-directed RNA polymerase specialized sigma24 family protein